MDPEAVAKQFVDLYYHTFDTNNPSFVSLYHSTRTPPCSPLRTPRSRVPSLPSSPASLSSSPTTPYPPSIGPPPSHRGIDSGFPFSLQRPYL
ncbi:NTF2-like protein [Dioscorea alata]|uniref:NTF2-like protein n=1 Tax=Dioscorea alata TaxID=55571 RepID=A0ACB7W444_DIOAL|nr:NTF2-like protein [Dioscorea alata]